MSAMVGGEDQGDDSAGPLMLRGIFWIWLQNFNPFPGLLQRSTIYYIKRYQKVQSPGLYKQINKWVLVPIENTKCWLWTFETCLLCHSCGSCPGYWTTQRHTTWYTRLRHEISVQQHTGDQHKTGQFWEMDQTSCPNMAKWAITADLRGAVFPYRPFWGLITMWVGRSPGSAWHLQTVIHMWQWEQPTVEGEASSAHRGALCSPGIYISTRPAQYWRKKKQIFVINTTIFRK